MPLTLATPVPQAAHSKDPALTYGFTHYGGVNTSNGRLATGRPITENANTVRLFTGSYDSLGSPPTTNILTTATCPSLATTRERARPARLRTDS